MPSHNVQLGVTAVIAGVVGAFAVVGFQQIRRQERIQRIRDEIPEVAEEHGVSGKIECVAKKTNDQQITEYGGASDIFAPSKEDERSTALALRARQGDYDDGAVSLKCSIFMLIIGRLNTGTARPKSSLPHRSWPRKTT